ncbi:MAG: hypothetical protein KAJ52_05075 [Sedimentisphaerales bacterium]|nr:hypothetical protein [Sedimentisphaerales bacterium]
MNIEHRTSNVQHPTSKSDRQCYNELLKMGWKYVTMPGWNMDMWFE